MLMSYRSDYSGCSGRKVLEVRTLTDEERIQQLENELEVTILFGEEADRKYEEVSLRRGIFYLAGCVAYRQYYVFCIRHTCVF